MLTSLEDLIEAIMGRKEEVISKLFTYIHTDSKFSFVPAFYTLHQWGFFILCTGICHANSAKHAGLFLFFLFGKG